MFKKIPLLLFVFSLIFFAFAYGFIAGVGKYFPYGKVSEIVTVLDDYFRPWYYVEADDPEVQTINDPARAQPGLNLVTCVGSDRMLEAKVVDMDGREIHRWDVDWFSVWPDAGHITWRTPKSRPGTTVHGATLTPEGDLIYNYEYLGLVRLSKSGEVVWRLPYQTHHSIFVDDDGNLWVPGMIDHTEPIEGFPNYEPPFTEYTVLKVSPEGEILKEFSLFDVLKENGLYGLLTMQNQSHATTITDDSLHLNDVEVFPRSMEEGFFKHGDIMVSLRNINAILVLTPEGRAKYLSIGKYVRQHDPDFIDGNTFSVFDNNTITGAEYPYSRIVLEQAPAGRLKVVYRGTEEAPFYTDIMGKHQWLENGNLLLTETKTGRAFEIAPDGAVVWDYHNVVGDETMGALDEVQRIPPWYGGIFQ